MKSSLTGLVATADEIAKVEGDPSALRSLISEWQKLPEYEARMIDLFTTAFQQGDVTAAMINNVTPYEQGEIDARAIANMRQSFGRTAMQLVKEGAPFTDVLTTRRFMLTPGLMVAMTWLDERQSADQGGVNDALNNELGDAITYTLQGDQQIALDDSINPQSPNFLKFHAPQLAAASGDCKKPIVVGTQDNRLTLYTHTFGETLMSFFMGHGFNAGLCRYPAMQNVLGPSDFDTWRMMTIRQPKAGEKRTWVYEIAKFRTGTELVYAKPQVGFYTTPAFLYTWQTNDSNQARVTINQTLIVATGRRFDGSLSAVPASDAAIDRAHAKPGSECFGCHATMDPMRQFFRNTFSFYWGLQENKTELSKPGVFVFDGVSRIGTGIADLGSALAESDRFALGWVHKLCVFATGAVCDPSGSNLQAPTDPEFMRIVSTFRERHYDWNALVQELFSSPLVTYAKETDSVRERGPTFPVAKKAQLCGLFDQRLGLTDVCGLRALPTTASGDAIKTIATILPADSYSRGQTVPTLANDPSLFLYAGVENICATLASRVVDAATGAGKWKSSDTAAAIGGMVHDLMGLQPREGTTAQRRFLEDHALSQRQVRMLSADLLTKLASIQGNGADAQMQAAIILIQLKVAPVVSVHIPFGGDNHFDADLAAESNQTVTGVATIGKLLSGLGQAGLSDRVTFASLNVFGRTLTIKGSGRSHNKNHHVSLLVGKNVKGSVIGGVKPMEDDYGAASFSSQSGAVADDGDVTEASSLASVGKTLGLALGVPAGKVEAIVVNPSTGETVGTAIAAALKI